MVQHEHDDLDHLLRSAVEHPEDALADARARAPTAPTALAPARSPALADADLEQLAERLGEAGSPERLHVWCRPRDRGAAHLWRTRLGRWLGVGRPSAAGMGFSSTFEEQPEAYRTTQHVVLDDSADLTLDVTTPQDEPRYVVVLGENSTGSVIDAGGRIAITSRGVPAHFVLGNLAAGDHLVLVVALAADPASSAALLGNSLHDLRNLDLRAVTRLSIRVGPR